MSARDAILGTIRQAKPDGAHFPLPPVPLFDDDAPADRARYFAERFIGMGGLVMGLSEEIPLAEALALPDEELKRLLRERLASAENVCSATPEVPGSRALNGDVAPTALQDVDVGVVRADFAVAETGSLCITDTSFVVNTLGYLPQHLIVLLDRREIEINLHHAYKRPEWKQHRYVVYQTGPSATADIEGVLIHGAQGVRSLTVVLLPRGSGL